MNTNDHPSFHVYRGLQKPLVFRSFKGRYIYWGLGVILTGLISAMVISSLANLFWGLGFTAFILGTGLGLTAYYQNRGNKIAAPGTFLIPNNPLNNDR